MPSTPPSDPAGTQRATAAPAPPAGGLPRVSVAARGGSALLTRPVPVRPGPGGPDRAGVRSGGPLRLPHPADAERAGGAPAGEVAAGAGDREAPAGVRAAPPAGPGLPVDPASGQHRCPTCGREVPERRTPDGRRRRGRPRVFCSERCRLGDRRNRTTVDPLRRRAQVDAFAAGVRTAIEASGLSLRTLERRLLGRYGPLASSVATLSAWQTGASAPPRTSTGRGRVLALERCLGLPAGDLALLMPGGAMVPAPRPPGRLDGLTWRRARLEHLVATRGEPQQVLPVSVTKDHRLGASRRPLCTWVTLEVRAAHDGVDRFWFLDAVDTWLDPTVLETSGCRVGERVVEPAGAGPRPVDQRLSALELVLDRPLATGERHTFSFLVQYDTEYVRPRTLPLFRHMETQPCERLDLKVSFDPRSVPEEVRQCRWRHRDLAEACGRPRTAAGVVGYQLVLTDPAPGGYGWRWQWGPAVDTAAA